MNTPEIASLLFQAGMVGAFIWYALARDRREAKERRDRDLQWRDFLVEERDQRKEAMEYGMHQVDSLRETIKGVGDVIAKHDAAGQGRYERLMKALMANAPKRRRRA